MNSPVSNRHWACCTVSSRRSAPATCTAPRRVATGVGRPCPTISSTPSRLAAAAGIPPVVPTYGSIDQRMQQLTQPILAESCRRGLASDVVFSGRTLPAPLALGILSLELVVHGWDFAMALHRPLDVSDTHAAQSSPWRGRPSLHKVASPPDSIHPCRCLPTPAHSSGSSRSPAATQHR